MACSNRIRAELNGILEVVLPPDGAVAAALLAAVVARGWCAVDRGVCLGVRALWVPQDALLDYFFPFSFGKKKSTFIKHVFLNQRSVWSSQH